MESTMMAGVVPETVQQATQGLSPPDSANTPAHHEASDSELSDLDDDDVEVEDLTPDHYADDGRVPVFCPTMDEFKDFELFMRRINSYGMKSGIVKVQPPVEWQAQRPNLNEAVKTIKVREPISQEIMGTGGTYRQANILHQRSYNLPQWRALCEQSEHQPPAKRGERRANHENTGRAAAKPRPSRAPTSSRRKAPGRGGRARQASAREDTVDSERLPTPVSPSHQDDGLVKEEEDEDGSPVKSKGGRGAKVASVSSRRKYNRKEAATKIDEAAFKDFEYELKGQDFTAERCEELERSYWKTLTFAPPLYGADMVGTLFDEKTTTWNLGNLPNLLDVMGTKIPGVNTAYLYLGMWKATFAWHLEDVDLYSINFLHFGAPKQWYSISQGDARRFEAAMKSIWPNDAKACDQFLRHKTFLISPSTLLQNYNIKVNKVVQHPGEFVITFPYGYHSGYNTGYNCAEAVNFGMKSWLDYGRIAKKCDCDQAQDSVWIDVREIERKLNGEPTDDELSEDDEDEDEDEDGPMDLPTPPESSGDTKAKAARRKRKRVDNGNDGKSDVKRLRVRIKGPLKEPCDLCPNDISTEPILLDGAGHKIHRLCAQYIPETDVDADGAQEIVTGYNMIAKARLELKCVYCRSKKGACFQCSFGKCHRAYHATCAAAAGVLVEKGETPVFGEDGTEYKTMGYEFSCRFHRQKRAKNLDGDALEKDVEVRKACLKLTAGDAAQFQYLFDKAEYFAGIVVENRRSEETLLVDILPRGDRVEIEYKYLRIADPKDLRLIAPSVNAIPLPKQSLTTTARKADDEPRKGDVFLEGFVWEEYKSFSPKKDFKQEKVDLSARNLSQPWHYLGKTSTEAKAQYTHNPRKPVHNPSSNYLDSIARRTQAQKPAPAPRISLSASYPAITQAITSNPRLQQTIQTIPTPAQRAAARTSQGPNQNALNAARATYLSTLSGNAGNAEKPYSYKPRERSTSGTYVDSQALRSQQNFLQRSVASGAGSSSGRAGWAPNSHSRSNSLSNLGSNHLQNTHRHSMPGKSGTSHQGQSQPIAAKSNNPFSNNRPSTSGASSAGRLQLGPGKYYKSPNPFAKYPYLQKQHNRSPLDYKSPYSQSGGFMNGYEGDLKAHLRQHPDALFRMSQSSPPVGTSSLYSGPRPKETQILPPPRRTMSQATPTPTFPQNSTQNSTSGFNKASVSMTATQMWEKKSPSQLHPAIRQDYKPTMFHQGYGPQSESSNTPPSLPSQSQWSTNYSGSPVSTFESPAPQVKPLPYSTQKSHQNYKSASADVASHSSPPVAQTPYAQIYQSSTYGNQKPIYPHQQFFHTSKMPQSQGQTEGQNELQAPVPPEAPVIAQAPMQTQVPVEPTTQDPLQAAAQPEVQIETQMLSQAQPCDQQVQQAVQEPPQSSIKEQYPIPQASPPTPQLVIPQWQAGVLPDVPADTSTMIEKMMQDLKRATARS